MPESLKHSGTAALLAGSGNGAPSPLAAVAGALARTSAESYSFSLNSTMRFAGRQMNSTVVSGAIDPRRELGAELLTANDGNRPAKARIRFIGRYVYTWVSTGSGFGAIGKPWNKSPIPSAGAVGTHGTGAYGFISDQPVSPAELSWALLSAGTVRDAGSAAGPGWAGTRYTFTTPVSSGGSVTGTVYVDRQGRVRRLVTITPEGKLMPEGKGHPEGRVTMDRDLTFSDFGAQEVVTAPPASQAEYTSSPYWGFYF